MTWWEALRGPTGPREELPNAESKGASVLQWASPHLGSGRCPARRAAAQCSQGLPGCIAGPRGRRSSPRSRTARAAPGRGGWTGAPQTPRWALPCQVRGRLTWLYPAPAAPCPARGPQRVPFCLVQEHWVSPLLGLLHPRVQSSLPGHHPLRAPEQCQAVGGGHGR